MRVLLFFHQQLLKKQEDPQNGDQNNRSRVSDCQSLVPVERLVFWSVAGIPAENLSIPSARKQHDGPTRVVCLKYILIFLHNIMPAWSKCLIRKLGQIGAGEKEAIPFFMNNFFYCFWGFADTKSRCTFCDGECAGSSIVMTSCKKLPWFGLRIGEEAEWETKLTSIPRGEQCLL